MDAQPEKKPEGCLEECYKNNLRIRLYQFTRNDRSLSHMIDVVAWNAWAVQGKIISAVGGIDLQSAQTLFQSLTTDLSHYDWMEDTIIMEGEMTAKDE